MSKHLICDECIPKYLPEGSRQIYIGSLGEPSEYQRLIVGIALAPTKEQRYVVINNEKIDLETYTIYNCDFCNKEIKPGDKCGALSIWTDRIKEEVPWEDDYLTKPIEGQKRNS